MVSAVTQIQYSELQKQVNELRERNSVAQGHAGVVDPELLRMAADVRALLATGQQTQGKTQQQEHTTSRDQWIIGLLVGAGIGVAGIALSATQVILKLITTPAPIAAASMFFTALRVIGR